LLRRPRIAPATRVLIVVAVTVLALAAAPGAFAHAILLQSTPVNDSLLQKSPRAVVLKFNEAVETAFGSIRVYDCGANRVDSGKITRPNDRTVSVDVPSNLGPGTYTVSWRVISADSHPVAGGFIFSIKSANPVNTCKTVVAGTTPGSVTALFKFMRALDFALILLVVGGAAVLALVLRSATARVRTQLTRILTGLAIGLVIAGALCIVMQGAVAGGFGLREAFRWSTVDAVLHTRFGKAFLAQLVIAAGIAVVALVASRIRALEPVVVIPAVLLILTVSQAGHARTSGSLALAGDFVHVLAASTWVGGLAFTVLALLIAGEDRWPLASRAVPRFSKLAVVSVGALILAGSLRGYEEVRTWKGLWSTTYGYLLLAKIGLVLPLLGLGAYNNRYAVPRLRRQIASLAEQRRFLRAAGAELAIMAVIVGVTAVLVTEPPAKAAIKPPKYFNKVVPIGNLELNLLVEPARTGPNVMHLYFSTKIGVPASVAEVKVSATLPDKNLGPLLIPLQKIVPSHYTTSSATFPFSGTWQLRIEARRGKFELLTQTVSVPIRGG
jgi:copper transport protein